MEIRKIAVMGVGAMGHGIAQVVAMSRFEFIIRDINYSVLKFMEEREPNFKASPLIKEKVEKGEIGVKAGKGFYTHPEKGRWVMPKSHRKKLKDSIP